MDRDSKENTDELHWLPQPDESMQLDPEELGNYLSDESCSTESDVEMDDYSLYSSTPTRTKIARKLKHKRNRRKRLQRPSGTSSNESGSKADKVNISQDSKMTGRVLEKPSSQDSKKDESSDDETDFIQMKKSADKHSLKARRNAERDRKLLYNDVRIISPEEPFNGTADQQVDTAPPQTRLKVESCKRFLSLKSKLIVPCPRDKQETEEEEEYKPSRIEFYNALLRCGNYENMAPETRRQVAMKEYEVWQNELKDLLWLELQAWHAGRTPCQQDEYLCEARKSVQCLLDDIMQYRFCNLPEGYVQRIDDNGKVIVECNVDGEKEIPDCCYSRGCLSMFCTSCIEQQNTALRQVDVLLNSLYDAGALYPSYKAFGAQYPSVLSEEFKARFKAMCLWYNMTKHHRLTVVILGRHLMQAEEQIPLGNNDDTRRRNRSVGSITNDSGRGESDMSDISTPFDSNHNEPHVFPEYSRSNYNEPHVFPEYNRMYSSATNSDCGETSVTYEDDCYDTRPIMNLGRHFVPLFSNNRLIFSGDFSHTYRKYIQTVLKTKGLKKALNFLEKLHRSLLNTARMTLEKYCALEDPKPADMSEEDFDLRRHGYWSKESQSLNLPSYRATFVFIARVPLDVIHAFLQMRLETRLEKPSILSIRQLIDELKEGLSLAVVNRQRCVEHVTSVLWEDDVVESFDSQIAKFDNSVQAILQVYLDYLTQWVQMIQQERVQKNVLEEEWNFIRSICAHMPGGISVSGERFCKIAIGLLDNVCKTLRHGADQLITTSMKCGQSESVKHAILFACRELQCLLGIVREKSLPILSLTKLLWKPLEYDVEHNAGTLYTPEGCEVIKCSLIELKSQVLNMCDDVKDVIMMVEKSCIVPNDIDEMDTVALQCRIREVLHQLYKFGFEYQREILRLFGLKKVVIDNIISFAYLWMKFVKERCERGRGLRPRWASQGIDFLLLACEPENTNHLSDEEFEEFRNAVEDCIMFIIGSTENENRLLNLPACISSKNMMMAYLSYSTTPRMKRRTASSSPLLESAAANEEGGTALSKKEKILQAVDNLEQRIDAKLRSQQLIGEVCQLHHVEDKNFIKPRTVKFCWQRGIKIGQGRFGKVYTAVNNQTGELLAMKEIQLQPFDHKAIRSLALELRIFEGIVHENLVRYYGVEVHKEEMLIFMELCPEGTLENLVSMTENGLPEGLIRKYMKQLVTAVDVLHQNTIVHRDIKSANIFLTNEGNCLKLGDFGSAVKIKAHTTVPGELRGFVGTQAYMAPEIFMKSTTEGHGRAVDIWSLGCVLVEMASGKRPWAEYDSNYQIMFKVGMGETPQVPDTLSDEGHHFASLCLQHNPRKRATTLRLMEHTFLKVDGEEEVCISCSVPSIWEEYLKLGIAR